MYPQGYQRSLSDKELISLFLSSKEKYHFIYSTCEQNFIDCMSAGVWPVLCTILYNTCMGLCRLTIVPATVGSEEGSISLLPQSCMEKESCTTPFVTNSSKTGVTLESGWKVLGNNISLLKKIRWIWIAWYMWRNSCLGQSLFNYTCMYMHYISLVTKIDDRIKVNFWEIKMHSSFVFGVKWKVIYIVWDRRKMVSWIPKWDTVHEKNSGHVWWFSCMQPHNTLTTLFRPQLL